MTATPVDHVASAEGCRRQHAYASARYHCVVVGGTRYSNYRNGMWVAVDTVIGQPGPQVGRVPQRRNRRAHQGRRVTDADRDLGQTTEPDKSESAETIFQRHFSHAEITAIEQWRAGNDLKMQVNVTGFGRRGSQVTWSYFRHKDAVIPRSAWIDTLATLRVLDSVHLAVTVTGDRRIEQGATYLRSAIDHHARGEYSAVAQACRKAVEEIGLSRFGAKPPSEIKKFLRNQDAKTYSLEERAAIVQTAAFMYLHSGSHAGDEERRWGRVDTDLALALAAALLHVAPTRLAKAEAMALIGSEISKPRADDPTSVEGGPEE